MGRRPFIHIACWLIEKKNSNRRLKLRLAQLRLTGDLARPNYQPTKMRLVLSRVRPLLISIIEKQAVHSSKRLLGTLPADLHSLPQVVHITATSHALPVQLSK